MAPDTDTDLKRAQEAQDEMASQADELEERSDKLGDDIGEARKGLRARREDAGLDDDADDDDEDDGDDPLAFDDPEEDEEDDDE